MAVRTAMRPNSVKRPPIKGRKKVEGAPCINLLAPSCTRLQQASEAHVALVEQVRAAGAAQRAADEGRWEKNARETDRLRVEVFDAAKAQSSVGNSHWESAQRRLAEHAEQLLRLQQQGDDGGGGGHGGGAGAGAGGGGAELAEHSKRLREHSAQLESLAQSQSEQHDAGQQR